MGGGGGGGGWGSWSQGAAGVDRAVANATATTSYDAEANSFLRDLLADYNDRDAETIQRHIETIRAAVEKDIDGHVDMRFGGSVRKHTYSDGISDIDVLMIVNASTLAQATPAQVLQYVEQRLAARLGGVGVSVKAGNLAVTVRYADGIEIQILPALKTSTGVRIASPEGTWSQVVRPQEFAKKLTTVNQANNGRVVPVIKLYKGLQALLPTNCQLKGYHVESLAIEAFRSYEGRQTLRDMLQRFVEFAASRVTSPMAETTGQSLHVDDHLGAPGSADRQRVAASLGRLATRLASIDKRRAIDDLKDAFGE